MTLIISTRTRRPIALGAVLLLLLGGCGGDDDTDAAAADTDTGVRDDQDASDAEAGPPIGGGQGTFVIDGNRYVTDSVICDLDGPGDEPTDFSYIGIGTLDGTAFSINATIGTIGGTIIDGLSVIDETGTAALYETAPETPDRPASEFAIDGRDVTYEAEFVGADGESSAGRGTFQVTCP